MATKKNKTDSAAKKVRTPEFRVSFPHVFKAHSGFEGQEPKFSLVMLFSKKTDITALKKAAFVAAVEKFGPKEDWPRNLRLPFRDGSEKEDLQGYKDTIFVTASSKQKPGVVDKDVQPIISEDAFYAGCYARATLMAFAYDTAGNKGISFGLQNIQKTKDGEQFSGRKRAEEEFDSIEDGSDDKSNYAQDSDSDDGFDDAGF